MRTSSISALVGHVRSLPGPYYLCREVADALDVSAATLRRLAIRDPGLLGPTHEVGFHGRRVLLYDEDGLERIHRHLAAHRSGRGRRRVWSDEERRARRAAHCAVGCRRRRAVQLRARGDEAAAAHMMRAAERLAGELRAAAAARQRDGAASQAG